jgi:hypothetical protein
MTAEVRLGDWRDVLPGTYDPERAVVITDPPFGIGRLAYADTVPYSEHVRDVLGLLPAVRHVIRGPGSLVVGHGHPAPRRILVEAATFRRRAAPRPGVIPYRWHGWMMYGRLKIGRRPHAPVGDWFRIDPYDDAHGGTSGGIVHDATTPYQACAWIVELVTEPGWLVVDPFAGVGTIGQAARNAGHAYLGAEIDPRWYAEASARIRLGVPLTTGL